MSHLFSPFKLRSLEIKNRVWLSPMCQYSCEGGRPNDWHLVHLGARASGGAGLVMMEATAVAPEGRISPGDCGLWEDGLIEAFRPITRFIRARGAVPAIQLAHAGRKGSSELPWRANGPVPQDDPRRWQTLAPSPVPFYSGWPTPREMTQADIDAVVAQFAAAARRAHAAGFEVAEVHMAHGYLLHEFLSPLSNKRNDAYGGSLENRMRLPCAVARAVREVWPGHLPVFVRLSVTDWVEGAWDMPQSVALCRALKTLGVDLVDCSSGFVVPDAPVPFAPSFQVPFAEAVRKEAGLPTAAVGMITEPAQAEGIVAEGRADAVFLGRVLLREPFWPLAAARALGADVAWPCQYERGKV